MRPDYLCRYALSALCFVGGAALAWHGAEGWGWFMFCGVIVSP